MWRGRPGTVAGFKGRKMARKQMWNVIQLPRFGAFALLAALSWLPGSLPAQDLSVAADQVACLPTGGNAVVWSTVKNNVADTTVRLYFRRLNDVVEDLYYVQMHPAGSGRYWGVMPKAEKRKLDRHELEQRRDEAIDQNTQAAWWREKESSDHRNPNKDLDDDDIRERASFGKNEDRHWMTELDDRDFEEWLDRLEFEPVEYFVSVLGVEEQLISRSAMMIGEVRSPKNCEVKLTPQQLGEANNLVVGETAPWQKDKAVFHWMCAGVVSRVGPDGVKRPDGACRGCVPCFDQAMILSNTVGGAVSPSDY